MSSEHPETTYLHAIFKYLDHLSRECCTSEAAENRNEWNWEYRERTTCNVVQRAALHLTVSYENSVPPFRYELLDLTNRFPPPSPEMSDWWQKPYIDGLYNYVCIFSKAILSRQETTDDTLCRYMETFQGVARYIHAQIPGGNPLIAHTEPIILRRMMDDMGVILLLHQQPRLKLFLFSTNTPHSYYDEADCDGREILPCTIEIMSYMDDILGILRNIHVGKDVGIDVYVGFRQWWWREDDLARTRKEYQPTNAREEWCRRLNEHANMNYNNMNTHYINNHLKFYKLTTEHQNDNTPC